MRQAMTVALAVLSAWACGGCAARPAWVPRAGGPVDAGLYRQDEDQCRRENPGAEPSPGLLGGMFRSRPTPETQRYEACMRTKGWARPGETR